MKVFSAYTIFNVDIYSTYFYFYVGKEGLDSVYMNTQKFIFMMLFINIFERYISVYLIILYICIESLYYP